MSKYRLQLISGSGKLIGMGHNKIMQPEINQPRVFDEHGQSGLKKAGILNLVADDLPHDMSLELRQNIISTPMKSATWECKTIRNMRQSLIQGLAKFWMVTKHTT